VYPFYPAIQFHILWQHLTYPHIPAISPSSPRAKLHFGTQLCGRSNRGNECRNTAVQLSRPIRGATQKFEEFKQRARTGCRVPFRR